MKQRSAMLRSVGAVLLSFGLAVTPDAVFSAGKEKPVSLILKNESGGGVQVEMIDPYGGNVTVTIDSGTSQNHTVKLNSAVKVDGNTVLKATAKDEGREVVVGR
jgi:hypothetical protein